jgi:hypothetical protein
MKLLSGIIGCVLKDTPNLGHFQIGWNVSSLHAFGRLRH